MGVRLLDAGCYEYVCNKYGCATATSVEEVIGRRKNDDAIPKHKDIAGLFTSRTEKEEKAVVDVRLMTESHHTMCRPKYEKGHWCLDETWR